MNDLILREFNGKTIRHREDGYFCLTDMAKATGKQLNDWTRLSSTIDLLSAYTRKTGIPVSQNLQIIQGTRSAGTWANVDLAIAFATWCSPEFFLVVIDWTKDILTQGYVIAKNDEQTVDAVLAEAQALKDELYTKVKLIRDEPLSILEFFQYKNFRSGYRFDWVWLYSVYCNWCDSKYYVPADRSQFSGYLEFFAEIRGLQYQIR